MRYGYTLLKFRYALVYTFNTNELDTHVSLRITIIYTIVTYIELIVKL